MTKYVHKINQPIENHNLLNDFSSLILEYNSLTLQTEIFNKDDTNKDRISFAREKYNWKDTISSITVLSGHFQHYFSEKHPVTIELSIVYDKNNFREIIVSLEQSSNDETDYTLILKNYYYEYIYNKILNYQSRKTFKYTIRNYKHIYSQTTFQENYLIQSNDFKIGFGPLSKNTLNETLTEHTIFFDIEVEASNFESARSISYNAISDFSAMLSVLIDVGFDDFRTEYLTFIDKDINNIAVKRHKTGIIDDYLNAVVTDNFYGIHPLEKVKRNAKNGINSDFNSSYLSLSSPSNLNVSITEKLPGNDDIENIFDKNRLYKTYTKSQNTFSNNIVETCRHANEALSVPLQIQNYIETILNLKESDYKKYSYFIQGCRMYNASKVLAPISSTIETAYLVASVESFAQIESKKFSPFCKEYNSSAEKKVLDFAYSIRSSHFHSGKFIFGEYNIDFNMANNLKFAENKKDYLTIKNTLRKAIVEWICTSLI